MWKFNNKFLKFTINNNNYNKVPKICAFDLDDTLIHVNKKYYTFTYIIDDVIINKILELISDGFLFVIFTNQSGITNNKNFNLEKWKSIIDVFISNITNKIKISFIGVYISINYDEYRKPNIKLWEQFLIDLNVVKIDESSFYCGDAVGRNYISTFKKKIYKNPKTGDHSNSDIIYSRNICVQFKTPEHVFLGEKNINNYIVSINPIIELNKKNNIPEFIPNNNNEIILMFGYPSSGKSYYINNFILHKYNYISLSLDSLKSKDKLLKQLIMLIKDNKNIIIDNTNLLSSERLWYIKIAKDNNYDIRLIKMNVSFELAKHLNNTRMLFDIKILILLV